MQYNLRQPNAEWFISNKNALNYRNFERSIVTLTKLTHMYLFTGQYAKIVKNTQKSI